MLRKVDKTIFYLFIALPDTRTILIIPSPHLGLSARRGSFALLQTTTAEARQAGGQPRQPAVTQAALWNRNRNRWNRNFLTSGTGTGTC